MGKGVKKAELDKMFSKPVMRARVWAAYRKYVRRFLSEWTRDDSYFPIAFDWKNRSEAQEFMMVQIKFIWNYLGFMLLAGPHAENLARIRLFLNLQGALKDDDKMEMRFLGGEPKEAYVYVSGIVDIDLEDVHSLVDFKTMHIYREGGKKWTKMLAKQIIREVRDDLTYDGDDVKLNYSYDGNLLQISCSVS